MLILVGHNQMTINLDTASVFLKTCSIILDDIALLYFLLICCREQDYVYLQRLILVEFFNKKTLAIRVLACSLFISVFLWLPDHKTYLVL